ncbi:Excision repair cross-complementation group 1, partial [Ascosphaera aggregata]
SYKESLENFITAPRAINKSDAASLVSSFGSLRNAINAHADQIVTVPGWGDRKVKQWCNAVREDFRIERDLRKGAHSKPRNTDMPFSISQSVPTNQSHGDEDLELLLAIKESLSRAKKMPTAGA